MVSGTDSQCIIIIIKALHKLYNLHHRFAFLISYRDVSVELIFTRIHEETGHKTFPNVPQKELHSQIFQSTMADLGSKAYIKAGRWQQRAVTRWRGTLKERGSTLVGAPKIDSA